LVLDGNFDNPSGGSAFVDFSTGQTFGPWRVTSSSVDLIGALWQSPTAGGGSVDMAGASDGSLSQTITVPTAGQYLLTFYLSGNPYGGPQTKDLQVSLGGTLDNFTYTLGADNSGTHMNYVVEAVDVTLAAGQNTLSFADTSYTTSPANNSAYGAVIGGVSLDAIPNAQAVPEPSTLVGGLLMLVPIGAGVVRRFRQPSAN
jgi:hypothetical protein